MNPTVNVFVTGTARNGKRTMLQRLMNPDGQPSVGQKKDQEKLFSRIQRDPVIEHKAVPSSDGTVDVKFITITGFRGRMSNMRQVQDAASSTDVAVFVTRLDRARYIDYSVQASLPLSKAGKIPIVVIFTWTRESEANLEEKEIEEFKAKVPGATLFFTDNDERDNIRNILSTIIDLGKSSESFTSRIGRRIQPERKGEWQRISAKGHRRSNNLSLSVKVQKSSSPQPTQRRASPKRSFATPTAALVKTVEQELAGKASSGLTAAVVPQLKGEVAPQPAVAAL